MQKIIVEIDWYTKIVLTLIAILLAGLLAKPYIVTNPASAYSEAVRINNTWASPVPVVVVDAVRVKGEVSVQGEVLTYTYVAGGGVSARITNWPNYSIPD